MIFKLYLTINIAHPDSPEWEDIEETPESVIEQLMGDIRYRVGHMPEGYISEEEIKFQILVSRY